MLHPWQLIKLKQQYGGVYVITYKNKFYVQRQPTLLELMQAFEAKNTFKLTTEQMFVELAKATLVYPEDPYEAPDEQIQMLAEQMLDDVPLTNAEMERKMAQIINSEKNFFADIAVELWQQISGTTIHEFYNRPIGEIFEMLTTLKIMQELMKSEQVQTYQQPTNQRATPNIEFENAYDQSEYQRYEPTKQQAQMPDINEMKQFFGKSLDEVIDMLQKKGGK